MNCTFFSWYSINLLQLTHTLSHSHPLSHLDTMLMNNQSPLKYILDIMCWIPLQVLISASTSGQQHIWLCNITTDNVLYQMEKTKYNILAQSEGWLMCSIFLDQQFLPTCPFLTLALSRESYLFQCELFASSLLFLCDLHIRLSCTFCVFYTHEYIEIQMWCHGLVPL